MVWVYVRFGSIVSFFFFFFSSSFFSFCVGRHEIYCSVGRDLSACLRGLRFMFGCFWMLMYDASFEIKKL
jgi:hypothetical protein